MSSTGYGQGIPEPPAVFPKPRTGARPKVAGTMIGPGRLKSRSTGDWVYLLGILDVATGKPRHIDLDFFGHGLVPNPVEPHKAALFEKIGKGAAEVDLRAGKGSEATRVDLYWVAEGTACDASSGQCREKRIEPRRLVRQGHDFTIIGPS